MNHDQAVAAAPQEQLSSLEGTRYERFFNAITEAMETWCTECGCIVGNLYEAREAHDAFHVKFLGEHP